MREPTWIEERDVLALHERLLSLHGGKPGSRDLGLLKSALARPLQHHAYRPDADVIELAAIYTAGIVGNHAFIDGDKRTGFVVGILFLELNGYRFGASEEASAQAVLALAASQLNEAGYAAFLRTNVKPIGRK
ncbi:MAG: type II toxin-antitoxin system death-on-curing family toxin [Enhydrobacter sp.]|nr:MAG: type II toxin-antitoxin system death-on-curing family toxin [Enhydrobacter sp.]